MVMNTLYKYYNEIKDKYPNNDIVGIFLFGSQNYNLNTETSDIDAIAIITPSWKNVVYTERPISTTIFTDEGSIKVMDVRLALRDMIKPTIFSIEALYTQHKLINDKYLPFWSKLEKSRNLIANGDIDNMTTSCLGVAHQVYKDGCNLYNKGEIAGAHKKLSRLVFINHFLCEYLKGSNVEDCYWVPEAVREEYLLVKNGTMQDLVPYSTTLLEEIEHLAKTANLHIEDPLASSIIDDVKWNITEYALTNNPL